MTASAPAPGGGRQVAGLGAGLGGVAIALAATMPTWWSVVLLLLPLALVAALHAVFPQQSADRLAWWQSRWQEQRLRRPPTAERVGRRRRARSTLRRRKAPVPSRRPRHGGRRT